ncbi:MAG: DUF1273 family protein [Ruminococcus sp.]|nr:DUF1273 family protein [Ruminococcus sp.]
MTYTITSTGSETNLNCRNEHEEPYRSIKKTLLRTIWTAYRSGADSFCVNCEYGIPLWAAEAICALKLYNYISLHIVIPFEEQCRDWSEDLRNRYYAVHEKANSVTFAEKQYSEYCYNTADEIMAQSSNEIIIFGDKKNPLYIAEFSSINHIPVKWISLP